MALHWEGEGNEDVVSEDKHVSELLAYNVPSGQHLLLVPEIINNVETCYELIGPHAACNLTVSLYLQS